MNRRTVLATTSLALVPRLSSHSTSDTEETVDNPPSLRDLLPEVGELPSGWVPGSPTPPVIGRQDDITSSTVRGVRSRSHPRKDESVSPRYAERRFVTDSELPPEFGHIDVAVEVARPDDQEGSLNRSQAVKKLHEVTLAQKTKNWKLMSTAWAELGITPTDDWLRDQSTAAMSKPQCAVPAEIDLSTDKPRIALAVAIEPLSWGIVVVTETLLEQADSDPPDKLVDQLASHVADTVREQPLPVEARQ